MEKSGENQPSIREFRQATLELDNIYAHFPKSCGLSDPEYWSLLLIYEGVMTQKDICDKLFISRQTLNSAFKQLQKKDLVRLEPCQNDLRSKQAFLTAKGQAFVKEHILCMHRMEEKAWAKMEADEQQTLTRLIRKFSIFIQKEMTTDRSSEG